MKNQIQYIDELLKQVPLKNMPLIFSIVYDGNYTQAEVVKEEMVKTRTIRFLIKQIIVFIVLLFTINQKYLNFFFVFGLFVILFTIMFYRDFARKKIKYAILRVRTSTYETEFIKIHREKLYKMYTKEINKLLWFSFKRSPFVRENFITLGIHLGQIPPKYINNGYKKICVMWWRKMEFFLESKPEWIKKGLLEKEKGGFSCKGARIIRSWTDTMDPAQCMGKFPEILSTYIKIQEVLINEKIEV